MRVVATFCLVLCWWALACSARAEGIRVLLAQEAQRVTVTADRGLVALTQAGQERSFAGPLVVTSAADGTGLMVNGEAWPDGSLLVRAQEGDLWLERPERIAVGGALQIASRGRGLMAVNRVELEEYVKGVVPAEMNAGWHQEALKVQAVVARTYALYQRRLNRDPAYDVVATVQDQVYRGRAGLDQRVQQAVEATRGLVLTFRNVPILAAFSSTAAGPTEDALTVWSKDLPYLKGVDCPFDQGSPYYQWRAEFTLQDLEDKLRRQGLRVGAIASLTPYAFTPAGRVTKLRLLHSQGELLLRGEDLRRAVGYGVIPSTQFEVESIGRSVVLTGRGAGHAVGLCQWGAKEMAELGYPFDTILRYYFPGTDLKDLRTVDLAPPAAR
ncbi:MAG: SpoIID/LytB domain-containing protein [Nitrospirota bacterium]